MPVVCALSAEEWDEEGPKRRPGFFRGCLQLEDDISGRPACSVMNMIMFYQVLWNLGIPNHLIDKAIGKAKYVGM